MMEMILSGLLLGHCKVQLYCQVHVGTDDPLCPFLQSWHETLRGFIFLQVIFYIDSVITYNVELVMSFVSKGTSKKEKLAQRYL